MKKPLLPESTSPDLTSSDISIADNNPPSELEYK